MTTKQDIVDYVMNTPENTNPTLLAQLLDDYANTSGSEMSKEEIEQFINEYLQQNLETIVEETVVEEVRVQMDAIVDNSLSREGFAADAAAVGDALDKKANQGTTLSDYGIIDGISINDIVILDGGDSTDVQV